MTLTNKELAPWHRRIANFERVIGRPSYIAIQDGWPFRYWFMGNDRSRDADYHGAYPGDYARRMRALFFDKQRPLHLFSGMVDLTRFPGDTLDINPQLHPTWCTDVHKSQGVVPISHLRSGTRRSALYQRRRDALRHTNDPAAGDVQDPDRDNGTRRPSGVAGPNAPRAFERAPETRMPHRNRLSTNRRFRSAIIYRKL